MKQGKTLQELGRELQRQRNNRQDFLADTRSLAMQSNHHGSTLIVSIDNKTQKFGVNEVAHQQIASRLNIPYRYYSVDNKSKYVFQELRIRLKHFKVYRNFKRRSNITRKCKATLPTCLMKMLIAG